MNFKRLLNFKKLWFIVASVLLVGAVYYFAGSYHRLEDQATPALLAKYIVIVAFISVAMSLFVQYLDGGDRGAKELAFVGLTPFFLCLGVLFFYLYYPNLSITIKIVAGLFYAGLLYTLLLLNNVLLVVKGREEVIPVYRVAVGWVQIVLLSVAITVFTGMHRLPVQPLLQTLAVCLIAFFFYSYSLWVYSFEQDIRKVKALEPFVITASLTVFTGWTSFTTLFFSGETFLRGLFIASVFLFGLGYIQLYLKNSLSKKTLWDYIAVTLIFFVVLLLFKP